MTIGERFRRWRANRGYGIHSPLAYRIVKNVVNPPGGVMYYGEECLKSSEISGMLLNRCRLLLRLVAELQPAYVWMSPGCPEEFYEAVRMGGGVVRIYNGEIFPDKAGSADMVVSFGYKLQGRVLRKILEPGKTLIAFSVAGKWMEKLTSLVAGGVVFEGVESVIALCRSGDASHIYKIGRF